MKLIRIWSAGYETVVFWYCPCCIRKEVGGLVVAWSCGLVVKALVAQPRFDSWQLQIFHLLSFLSLCKSKQLQ